MTQSGAGRAIVTGAASGIGQAVAFRLLREGIDVLAVDLDEERLAPVVAKGARPMTADVSNPADRERIAAAADGLAYLVNGAGIISLKPILEVTPQEWLRPSATPVLLIRSPRALRSQAKWRPIRVGRS